MVVENVKFVLNHSGSKKARNERYDSAQQK